MQNIIIDEEFKRILPVLDEQTYAWLEENILEFGCREPLVLWNGILIDGHNRYEILTKHELPINTINMEFDSRDDVLIWIISTQISRRNLNPLQLSYYRGLHYNTDKKRVGANNQYTKKSAEAQNGPKQKMNSTAGRLASEYKVSKNTIKRDAQVANAINAIGASSPETKVDILSGKTRISRKQLQEISSGTNDDVADVVTQISNGSFLPKRHSSDTQVAHTHLTEDGVFNSSGMQPWEMQFSKMADEFRKLLNTYAKTDDKSSAKSALRQYITMLEELYRNI